MFTSLGMNTKKGILKGILLYSYPFTPESKHTNQTLTLDQCGAEHTDLCLSWVDVDLWGSPQWAQGSSPWGGPDCFQVSNCFCGLHWTQASSCCWAGPCVIPLVQSPMGKAATAAEGSQHRLEEPL